MQRYVSNELTHFVGGKLVNEYEQFELLLKILDEGVLTSGIPKTYGFGDDVYVSRINPNSKISHNEMFNPSVICFCDIPVADFEIHVNKYSPFGLSFQKSFLVEMGANPVFYIANNSTANYAPLSPLLGGAEGAKYRRGTLFDNAISAFESKFHELVFPIAKDSNDDQQQELAGLLLSLKNILDIHILSFIKCFDDSTGVDHNANYYMEREWRLLGRLKFELNDVERIIIPKTFGKKLRERVSEFSGQVIFA